MTGLIAHRGGSGLRVENTLAAFRHAIELGVVGAELDVHLSRDGHVVVHHDDALNPGYCRHGQNWIEASARPAIADLTLAQLKQYDIGTPRPGSAYARRFARIRSSGVERIPLLAEVVDLARQASGNFKLVVEIKSDPLDAARRPWVALVDATLAVLRAGDFLARSVLCSFDWTALFYARRACPELPIWCTSPPLSWLARGRPPASDIPPSAAELARYRRAVAGGRAAWRGGYDPNAFAGSFPRAVRAADAAAWFPYYRDVDAALCRESAGLGLTSTAWSVNLRDAGAIERLLATGIDYFVTDYPDLPLPG